MSPDLFVPNYMKSAFFPHTYSLLSIAKAVFFSFVPTLWFVSHGCSEDPNLKTDVSLI